MFLYHGISASLKVHLYCYCIFLVVFYTLTQKCIKSNVNRCSLSHFMIARMDIVHTDDQVKETMACALNARTEQEMQHVMDHFSSCANFISTTKRKVMFLPVPGKP